MATLKDIAKTAGVSMATVSNVINGNYNKVSSETVERIQSIIQKTGYVPNQVARSLAQKESRVVAIIVQAHEGENIFRNPYTAEYVGALTIELYQKNYYPLIRFTNDFESVENDLRRWKVAGAIFNGSFSNQLQRIHALPSVPTVFTDCYFRIPGINHVGVDDEGGGQMAGEYLGKKGHRCVAFIANDLAESEVDQHRLKGFQAGLKSCCSNIPDEYIFDTPLTAIDGERIKSILGNDNPPTAFFCTSDRVAVQLIQTLNSLHIKIPDDVSVMGFDNLPIAEITYPPLTTLCQDIAQKAHVVVDVMARHIKQKDLPPERTTLGVSLVERESVKKMI